jgi:hypothetical protein
VHRVRSALLLILVVVSFAAAPLALPNVLATGSAQLPPVVDADSRWGINHVYADSRSQQLARDAGARWNRWEFRWDEIETAQGQASYAAYDAVVSASLAHGLSVQGILISFPSWAKDPQSQLSSGLYLPWNDQRNLWGRFVRNTAARYRGSVRHWEAWNEPDSAELFWPGSIADYYQLLKVTYLAVKSVDPTAQVLLGGLGYWTDPDFLASLLRLMVSDPTARGNNAYFDVVVWHTYSRPTDVLDRVAQGKQLLASTVGPRPIWVNETNVPAWDESAFNGFRPYQWSATIQEQASYMIQALTYGVAAGADKVFVYRMQDTDWPEAYGLLRRDGTLRPAYTAYQVATRYLSRASAATLARQGDAEQVIIRRPGERIAVVWNRTPTRLLARFGASTASATVVDHMGATRTIRPSAGQYQIELAPATDNNGSTASDYIIGGPPLLIVESLPSSQQTAEESSALITYGGTWFPLSASGPSGGGVRRAGLAGSSATIGFDGASVTWVTSKGPDRGIARVAVDGIVQGDVDLYNPTVLWDVPLTFGNFTAGSHRVTVIALGQRSSAATGTFVDLDAFAASTLRSALAAGTATPPAPGATPTPTRSAAPATPRATLSPTAPPAMGGRGFTLQSRPVVMTWTGGGSQTAYVVARLTSSGVEILPSTGPLAPSATAFIDTSPSASPVCYALLPVAGAPPAPIGSSDLLCLLPNTASARGSPQSFTIRLDQSNTATFNWIAPGGQTGYVLVPIGGSPTVLPSGATTTTHLMAGSTCYTLVAINTQGIQGNTDVLCAIPGVASLGAGASGASAAATLERARDAVLGR